MTDLIQTATLAKIQGLTDRKVSDVNDLIAERAAQLLGAA